jgi:hypothetical protein
MMLHAWSLYAPAMLTTGTKRQKRMHGGLFGFAHGKTFTACDPFSGDLFVEGPLLVPAGTAEPAPGKDDRDAGAPKKATGVNGAEVDTRNPLPQQGGESPQALHQIAGAASNTWC